MADDNPIRFGIIGCAEIARKVSRAIHKAPNSTLYAVASRSIEKAKQFAVKNGLSETVKIYGSYDELLDDPCVDAVYMPLPTSLHRHWGVLAAQKKKHLLLEKPTALDLDELDMILEACESNGVQFMDGSMWYHHPRTAKMKELLSDSQLFGQPKSIHSSSTYAPGPEFLEKDVRVKPELDALAQNSAGVILSCTACLNWDKEETVATFHCSFLSHETMDVAISGSNGSLHLEDFIIPYQESSASFDFTSGAKFVDLHIGWNVKPEKVQVASELPQEAMMVQEFARLVKGIRDSGCNPDSKWAKISRMTQLVLDAVKKSINIGFKPVCL
ncbi:hypothetical protein F0562_004105 [Nyssa sinensis]|uniref:Gfo/Idh/MocA-like oxidoreductase N-terminal domain-containing protein n=1 Tax=Nyssa sinensis TaxID=561372 RepID=A0A5J5BYF8_9ASTE|nr:hypothetical protein F0562_004105 [Nyssa sinensis]